MRQPHSCSLLLTGAEQQRSPCSLSVLTCLPHVHDTATAAVLSPQRLPRCHQSTWHWGETSTAPLTSEQHGAPAGTEADPSIEYSQDEAWELLLLQLGAGCSPVLRAARQGIPGDGKRGGEAARAEGLLTSPSPAAQSGPSVPRVRACPCSGTVPGRSQDGRGSQGTALRAASGLHRGRDPNGKPRSRQPIARAPSPPGRAGDSGVRLSSTGSWREVEALLL